MPAAAQQSSFDKPRWLEVLAAEFGATLNAGSGSGSDWESEDEDEQLDDEDDVLDEALAEVMEDDARDVVAQVVAQDEEAVAEGPSGADRRQTDTGRRH